MPQLVDPDFPGALIHYTGEGQMTLLEYMKQRLGVTSNEQDVQLSCSLNIAGVACEKYADNIFDKRQVIEEHERKLSPIPLRYFPASDLFSVELDGQDETERFTLYNSQGIVWAKGESWSHGTTFEQLSLIYDAGYSPMPLDLADAIVTAAIAYENQSTVTAGAVKKETIVGVGSIEYNVGSEASSGDYGMIPAAVISVLERYTRRHA